MRRGSSQADIVEYRGNRYRRYPESKHKHLARYYQATEPRRGYLHRHIWEDHNGPIPQGHDVHHKDENTLNNDPLNLECLSKLEHRRRHPVAFDGQQEHLERQRVAAAEWHGSAAGREWHREHGKRTWEGREPVTRTCECCSVEFSAFFERARFCSRACAQRFRYHARSG